MPAVSVGLARVLLTSLSALDVWSQAQLAAVHVPGIGLSPELLRADVQRSLSDMQHL